ncbi:type II secretion system F family protein [Kineococcus radiotolerans]|uniref:Type II secretion system protein n=1 Tax=Kineococcus radiotolerans (strain ATCC BAA-149 / DSM 14245 / SRS30216) TaxID=266940 RepID=A6WCF1_KINRD|nr:type II secretion system F family protein [Kineococcus radiotolerans]ABS04490.1 type II secretion system protein [Kineococcus radiotolerans SRS30216 = ATCC BAA-149]
MATAIKAPARSGHTTFEYSARDRSGKLVKGVLEASDSSAVLGRLKSQGLAPVSVEASKAGKGMQMEIALPGSNRVGLKDLALMSRQFATMVSSGLSLIRALSILAEQAESKKLAATLGEVRAEVETGASLSTTLAKHDRIFPPLMINMIRAGEVGGFLDQVLVQIADNFESEVKLKAKVKSAMTYPVVVFIIAILAVVGMLLFIVPVFTQMFSDLGGKLPLPTQILVYLSTAMKWGAPFGVVALVVGSIVWNRVRNKDEVRNIVDPVKLKMPIFGSLTQKIALSRFTRNLGTMLRSGVPILQSLEIVGNAAGNVVIRRAAIDVMESVRSGRSLAGPLAEHKVFPAMVVQMMSVGEDTGALDSMLHKISDFYDQEVEATTDALTSLIEPLMIAVLGGIIGSMIIALYMPIFGVFNLIS